MTGGDSCHNIALGAFLPDLAGEGPQVHPLDRQGLAAASGGRERDLQVINPEVEEPRSHLFCLDGSRATWSLVSLPPRPKLLLQDISSQDVFPDAAAKTSKSFRDRS